MKTSHALRRTIAVTAFVWVLAAGHATHTTTTAEV